MGASVQVRGGLAGLALVGCAVALNGAACGGATKNDLFGGGPSDGSILGADGSLVGTDAGVAPGSDAATDPDATDADGGRRDAGRDAAPVDPGIRCEPRGTFCTVGTQVCCRSAADQFSCVAANGCYSVASMPIPCDDADDCAKLGHPGDVCCATVDLITNRATEVTCRSGGDCTRDDDRRVLCDPQLPSQPQCPANTRCQASTQILSGFYLCL